jgi:hypothetical protein
MAHHVLTAEIVSAFSEIKKGRVLRRPHNDPARERGIKIINGIKRGPSRSWEKIKSDRPYCVLQVSPIKEFKMCLKSRSDPVKSKSRAIKV